MNQNNLIENCADFLIEQGVTKDIKTSPELFEYHWRAYCLRYFIPYTWPIDWNKLPLGTTIALERIENERKARQAAIARSASVGTMRQIPLVNPPSKETTEISQTKTTGNINQLDSTGTDAPVTKTVAEAEKTVETAVTPPIQSNQHNQQRPHNHNQRR